MGKKTKSTVITKEQLKDLQSSLKDISSDLEYVFAYPSRNTMQIAFEVGKVVHQISDLYIKLDDTLRSLK